MLTNLRLQNFRCFDDHTLEFKPLTIVVGRNNAGKSTLVEALRLVSVVTSRYEDLNYQNVPSWLHIEGGLRGVAPSLHGIELSPGALFNQYGDPPAVITAHFADKSGLAIYLGSVHRIHAVIFDKRGNPITSKTAARSIRFPLIATMPQVGPLEPNERTLEDGYIRRSIDSFLAPRHFRNQLKVLSERYTAFKQLVETTWPSVRVVEFKRGSGLPDDPLNLLIQDRDFVAEAANMGHGLQMWLQTMWFLARAGTNATVVLDEPDVYMHADLQRKLMRVLKARFKQILVATHSTEILSEVEPENVLIVDRYRARSDFAANIPAVQQVLRRMGSAHNIQLTRLWHARKCLLVEGKDVTLLKHLHATLFPNAPESLELIPHMAFGGWGGWQYAVGSRMFLENSGGEEIASYCLLDRDYHTEQEVAQRAIEAQRVGVRLHVWLSKELENYLLNATAIARIIAADVPRRTKPATIAEVSEEIDAITERDKNDIVKQVTSEVHRQNRAAGIAPAMREARQLVETDWPTPGARRRLLPGKAVLSEVSRWSQEHFGVALSAARLARELRRDEIVAEVRDVLESIEAGREFPT
jgi:energy-coupling factor transporter ATP-binding protein EcfA2